LRKSIEKYLKEVDEKLMPILETAKTNLGAIHKQFAGLMHLTDEQKQHIEAITKMANRRIDSLKETVAELTKKSAGSEEKEAEVARLTARVTKLEGDLSAKEAEMETQRVGYEEALDYYESIMIKMKKAQMEAERHLRNMEVELGMESTAKKGKVLSESTRPTLRDYFEKKKKTKDEYDW
jgi:multidrug resistance efflux pump